MPGAKDMLSFVKKAMPSFIVSTSYEHYLRALCSLVDFPFENTYCTRLDLDKYVLNLDVLERIKRLIQEIVALLLMEVPEKAQTLDDFSERDQQTIKTLDRIFWKDLIQTEAGKILKEVNPVGGSEKAEVLRDIIKKTGSRLNNVMYVGDSITDLECFRLVRENDGLAVSFNGNAYAIREAEIAALAENATITAIVADVFNRMGKKAVLEMASKWSFIIIEKYEVNLGLQEKVAKIFQAKQPKLELITTVNKERLVRESSDLRKHVRGEAVGKLG